MNARDDVNRIFAESEIEKLREENAKLRSDATSNFQRIAELEAENARLREVLRPLATWHQNASENCDCHFCRARKVLGGEG